MRQSAIDYNSRKMSLHDVDNKILVTYDEELIVLYVRLWPNTVID